ncbi:MAG TPA: phenylalanine--tRNA ligase beta subunit-related protein [Pyrinomonadaceae bacterium]|nr:phenylalanine--tRNA ligase beta subunit-related protein [Pyrinomonadaceae bacterium]
MTTLELQVRPEVREKFPEFSAGGFLAANLERAAESLRTAAPAKMERARAALTEAGLSVQNLVGDPRVATWREAFSRSGLKPSTYKSSAEQLGRRLLRGELIETPLPLVTTYCAVAARHLAALGGYDLASLPERRVEIRFARPDADSFRPLGGRAEDMPLRPEVVVYAAGGEVLCYSFNHRDSKATCLAPQTSAAVFFGEGVSPAQADAARGALEDLRALLREAGAHAGEVKFTDAELRAELTLAEG